MQVTTHDTTRCLLGEGAFWHPVREQFYWCDILSNRVLTRENGLLRDYTFDTQVSCLGWLDRDRLVAATAHAVVALDLSSGAQEHVCDLETERNENRSNDGRADPMGGFWIGTMGIDATAGSGAIYRLYRGEMRQIVGGMTIPNAICFAPDGGHAYYADTTERVVWRLPLDGKGWPSGERQAVVDMRDTPHAPDGAVCDADGNIWIAEWGSSRVGVYTPDGAFLHAIQVPARQVSCPAFGGADLTTLYCTTAAIGIPEHEIAADPSHGRTYRIEGAGTGRPEHQVTL